MLIFKYLKRTKDYMLVSHCYELVPLGCMNSNFQSHRTFTSLPLGCIHSRWSGCQLDKCVVVLYFFSSTKEVEYVVAFEVAKKVVQFRKFLNGLKVIPMVVLPIILSCDNSGMVTQFKEPKNNQNGKHKEKVPFEKIPYGRT